MVETVKHHKHASADEVVTAIANLTDEFADGAPFRDDRTAIVIKRTG